MTRPKASNTCSGCGTPGTRIDFCASCSPGSPRVHDARALANRVNLPPRKRMQRAETSRPVPPVPPAAHRSVLGWSLTFVPLGKEEPVVLDARLPTATDAQRVAETYNKLDWETHQALGSDRFIALGRKGAFILEPVTR